MNLSEASRQYQAALEHARRARTEYEGVLSADDILDDAQRAVEDARVILFSEWAQRSLSVTKEGMR